MYAGHSSIVNIGIFSCGRVKGKEKALNEEVLQRKIL